MGKDSTSNSLIVKSSVEQAIERANEKKGNRLSLGASAQRAQISERIVSNSVNNLLSSLTLPKCRKDDIDEIRSRTIDYMQRCVDAQCIPLIEDWAVALGISRATMYRWFDRPGTPEIGEFLERVRTSIYAANAQAAYQNAINCVSWIFYAKNSLGMTDKTEISVSPGNNSGEEITSSEDLRKKYLDAVCVDDHYEGAGDYVDATE